MWKHLNQRSKTISVEATSLLHCHMMKFIQFFSSLHTPCNFVRTVPQWQQLGLWILGGHYIMAVLRANSITWRNEFCTLSRCSIDSAYIHISFRRSIILSDMKLARWYCCTFFSGCEMFRKMFLPLPTDSSKFTKIADWWNMF